MFWCFVRLDRHGDHDFEFRVVRSTCVAAPTPGRLSLSAWQPGRLEKKGANLTRPRDRETTNRYNETVDVDLLLLELASGIKTVLVVQVLQSCEQTAAENRVTGTGNR